MLERTLGGCSNSQHITIGTTGQDADDASGDDLENQASLKASLRVLADHFGCMLINKCSVARFRVSDSTFSRALVNGPPLEELMIEGGTHLWPVVDLRAPAGPLRSKSMADRGRWWAVPRSSSSLALTEGDACVRRQRAESRHPEVTPGHKSKFGRSRAELGVFGCVAICVVVLGACGQSVSTSNAAIVSGWKNAISAFAAAVRNDDWNNPMLIEDFAAPQLGVIKGNLQRMRAVDEIATGSARVISATVTSATEDRASVQGCIQDDELVLNANTGSPVPGPAGERTMETIRSTLVRSSGRWKVDSQTVTVGKCPSR